MAPSLSWLQGCKSAQLKAIAIGTGVNSSGTKSVLISQLLQHLSHGYLELDAEKRRPRNHYDVISIDMGIRNLAYCRLQYSLSPLASRDSNLVISDWARVEVSKGASRSNAHDESKSKEAFDPATYSQYAYDLVSALLTNAINKPTHILIERQRFRSMGGSAVQEWTLRVNMFEAMLYAVMKTLSKKGFWPGSVHPVAPGRVSRFWLGNEEGAVEGKESKSAKTKTAKIELVEKWLNNLNAGDMPFKLQGAADLLAREFLRKRKGGKRITGRSAKSEESGEKADALNEVGKLDDLADCLLQGVAWIQWEQNRRLIASKGIEAMDEIH